jgi:hypothetical protein
MDKGEWKKEKVSEEFSEFRQMRNVQPRYLDNINSRNEGGSGNLDKLDSCIKGKRNKSQQQETHGNNKGVFRENR